MKTTKTESDYLKINILYLWCISFFHINMTVTLAEEQCGSIALSLATGFLVAKNTNIIFLLYFQTHNIYGQSTSNDMEYTG